MIDNDSIYNDMITEKIYYPSILVQIKKKNNLQKCLGRRNGTVPRKNGKNEETLLPKLLFFMAS